MVPDQPFPIPGQVIPGSGHLQQLIALLPLRHLLSKHPTLFGVFSVFCGGFHSRLYASRQINVASPGESRSSSCRISRRSVVKGLSMAPPSGWPTS